MWWPESNTVIPEPGTRVSVRFERECWANGEEWYEERWVTGVVISSEEVDGRSRALVELDTYEVELGLGLVPCGPMEVVGSVRVHCAANNLRFSDEWKKRDFSLVSPRDGADSSPAIAARTG